jgi:hypothetical protein
VLWLFWFNVFVDVKGTEQPVPRTTSPYGVYFKTKYGNITITNSQTITGPANAYANGTVYFNLGLITQPVFSYQAKAYGNGSFQVIFNYDRTPTTIQQLGSVSSIETGAAPNFRRVITYTTAQDNPLVLVFNINIISGPTSNAAWFLASFLLACMVLTGLIMAWHAGEPEHQYGITTGKNGTIVIVTILIVIFIITLFVALFKGIGA